MLVALLVVPIVVLLAYLLGRPSWPAGCIIVISVSFASLGAAGLAGRMAGQIQRASPGLSSLAAYVRSAVALELAAAFPVIGWFVAVPLLTVAALGATVFALLHSVPGQTSAPLAAAAASAAAPRLSDA